MKFILPFVLFALTYGQNDRAYLPHYTFVGGHWKTEFTIANMNSVPTFLTITAWSDQGTALGELRWELDGFESRTQLVSEAFPNLLEQRGWLQLSGDLANVRGTMTFEFRQTGGATSLPLVLSTSSDQVLVGLDHRPGQNSGFAIVNPTATDLQIEMQLVGTDGS